MLLFKPPLCNILNLNGASCWWVSRKQLNKKMHSENGNIGQKFKKRVKSLKILHLNKGSKFLTNSNELINDLIIKEDPDIFSLAESNINFNFDKKEIGKAFETYNIEVKRV